jgi:Rrf2 family protein
MLSRTAEYALRTVVYLAGGAPQARTTEQIATATKVPHAYLSKVIQHLNRSGILRSQRGIGGGVSLLKQPGELTVLDVVTAVDPIRRIDDCPLGLAEHGAGLCPLHRRLDSALALVEQAFAETTLAHILADGDPKSSLCEFPGGTNL